jgi:hypothetical protein
MYSRTCAQKYRYTEKEEHRRMGTQENRSSSKENMYTGEKAQRRRYTGEQVYKRTRI